MKTEDAQIEALPTVSSDDDGVARGPATPPASHEDTREEVRRPEASFRGVGDHLRWIWRYWRPLRARMLIISVVMLTSAIVAVAYPLTFRWAIDRLMALFQGSSDLARLSQVLLVLGLIAVGRFIAGFNPAVRAWTNLKLDKDIREDVFGHLMKKDFHFNNAFRTGDIVTRLTDDIYEFPKISWFSCSGIFRAAESSLKLLLCIAAMMALNWKLTLVSIVPLPIMMGVFYSLRHRIRRYVGETQKAISDTSDLLEAAFAGIRIVKAFRGEGGQKRRLAALMKDRRRSFLELMKVQTTLWSLDTLASRLGQMIVIAVGGFMVVSGDLTIGTLFAFYVFLDMLSHPMMDLPHMLMSGQRAFVSIHRVEEIKSYPVQIRHAEGEPVDGIDEIAAEDVSFSYDGGRAHVRNVTFTVPAGRRIAVVGPVGSGKSTLLKLLAGILVPEEGSVRVNGRDLRDLDWNRYRRLLGYVPQEGVLFSNSIRENVMFGREAPGNGASPAHREEWVDRCLKIAQMEADLRSFPQGMTTTVGTRGLLVSGGQMQRIAIARALAGKPEVLLLDDCTAALDAHNEEQFWAGLSEFGRSTCFIVSHRITTIRQADHILVLDDGRLVDQGTHEELEGRCEVYRKFLMTEIAREHLGLVGTG